MTDEKSHPIRNSVVTAIAVALIGSFVTFILPGGWQTVFTAIGAVVGWLGRTTTIPNWLLTIFVPSTASLVLGVILILSAHFRKSAKLPKPPVEMTILGIHWRWEYGADGSIQLLTPFCPKCGLQINPPTSDVFMTVHGAMYVCDDCNWKSERLGGSTNEVEDRVKRKIKQQVSIQASRERNDNV